jgi:hypothetical protein
MLAFTDTAFARLCIAASRIDPRRRRQWLQEIAAKLDPQTVDLPDDIVRAQDERTPAARRQARVRARRKNGTRCYTVEVPDEIVEGMITALVATDKLTEAEACDHARVQAELGRMLVDWARRWMR